MSQTPYRQPAPPPVGPGPGYTGISIGGFIVALCAFLFGIIPFVGFLGIVGVILCVVDLQRQVTPGAQPPPRGLSIAGLVMGGLAIVGAIVWVVAIVWLEQSVKKGSCPHLYAHDGTGYTLDADLASGALYRGAERDDMDRLESLAIVDGQYKLRIQNDLQEIDNVDRLTLMVVDAPPDVDVLPTQTNDIVGVRGAAEPSLVARASFEQEGNPRVSTSFTFARPAGVTDKAVLVVRARSTPFAEEAFVAYMAKMGAGVRPLMEYRADSSDGCACYQKYLSDEMDRMGLSMGVSAGASRVRLVPVGPAILRTQAVPIDVPRDGDRIVVRLETTPEFWEIASVALAGPATDVKVSELAPASASKLDAKDRLTNADEQRVVLGPGESVDVAFDAPSPPALGAKRTVIARLRGYYDLDIGGQAGVDVTRLVAHRAGWVSLPRFAAAMRRPEQPAPRAMR